MFVFHQGVESVVNRDVAMNLDTRSDIRHTNHNLSGWVTLWLGLCFDLHVYVWTVCNGKFNSVPSQQCSRLILWNISFWRRWFRKFPRLFNCSSSDSWTMSHTVWLIMMIDQSCIIKNKEHVDNFSSKNKIVDVVWMGKYLKQSISKPLKPKKGTFFIIWPDWI